jgi:hypothetical protein
MITNIDIDEAIVAEAMRLSGARSKRDVVDRALREMVERRKRPSIQRLFGIGGVAPDYDPKLPWARGAVSGHYRVEQPKARYQATRPARAKLKRPASSKQR